MPYRQSSPLYKRAISFGRKTTLHRAVLEAELGRPLPKHLHVHHINGDKLDNRLENLEVIRDVDHGLLHSPPKHPTHKRCEWCGTLYRPHKTKRVRSKACSPECARSLAAKKNTKVSTAAVLEMRQRGMTQSAIARELGVTQSTIWLHLRKHAQP